MSSLPTAINTKRKNHELFQSGAFGNTVQTWNNLVELNASDYRGPVTIRYNGKAGGGPCVYNIPFGMVENALMEINTHKPAYELALFYFNETCIDANIIMQGEYCESDQGTGLYYSVWKEPMRIALKQAPRHHIGPYSFNVAKAYMWPAAIEALEFCRDQWPKHAIEFSVYSKQVGTNKQSNTIIWEVRNY